MAHFFVVVIGSKIHERVAHFFIDIYTYQPISALHAILKGITRIKAGIKSTRGTDLILETRKPAAIAKMPPEADKCANIVGVK